MRNHAPLGRFVEKTRRQWNIGKVEKPDAYPRHPWRLYEPSKHQPGRDLFGYPLAVGKSGDGSEREISLT